MRNRFVISAILAAALSASSAYAIEGYAQIQTINPLETKETASETKIDLTETNVEPTVVNLNEDKAYTFANATDKFVQSNVKASYKDFQVLINNVEPNDFVYLSIATKMADLGLFNLSNTALSKVKDTEISRHHADDIKRYYFPRKKLKPEDEMYLGEIYSNIIYNDQARESANELLQNTKLMSTSDYANYLVALGSYKSNNYSRATQYIDIAILQNPTNLNFQKLKAEILANSRSPEDAIKVVDHLKKQNLNSYEFQRKVKSLEQYVLYKNSKTEWEKNYHLGYFYYYENDPSKAVRTLNNAVTNKKKNNVIVYALIGKINLEMNEYEKAAENTQKAYKISNENAMNLVNLGDLRYVKKDYKPALKFYKEAAKFDKTNYQTTVKVAQTYKNLNNDKKAKEIYTKILKTNSDCYEAYYNIALMEPEKEITYLKKSLGVNLLFKDGWIDLARVEIGRSNWDNAKKYLSNAFYIDENDFRYYYYQGLVCKNENNLNDAQFNFKKSLKLNPNFEAAKKELSI